MSFNGSPECVCVQEAERRIELAIPYTPSIAWSLRKQPLARLPLPGAPAEHRSGTASSASPMVAACAATTLAAWMCSVRDTCWCPPAGTASGASALAACTWHPFA